MARDLDVAPIPADLSPDAPEFAQELDEAILSGIEPPEPAQKWEIRSTGQAEWAMRKLAVLKDRERDVQLQAIAWRERIEQWEREELKRTAPGVEYFTGHLERYGLENRILTGRASVPLPSGEISTRQPKTPTVVVVDEEALLQWLADNLPTSTYEAVVQVTHKPKILELRRNVEARPVPLPFCIECGASIVCESDLTAEGPKLWTHEGDAREVDDDHPATPAPGFEVVWSTEISEGDGGEEFDPPDGLAGEVIEGLGAALGDATASVKVTR